MLEMFLAGVYCVRMNSDHLSLPRGFVAIARKAWLPSTEIHRPRQGRTQDPFAVEGAQDKTANPADYG